MTTTIKDKTTDIVLVNCYAPTMVDDQHVIEAFYEELKEIIEAVPTSKDLIITGDFNARVGKSHLMWKGILGPHGVGEMNSSGLRLLQLCAQQSLRVTNTFFQQKNKFKTTWQHPRSKQWHTLDYVVARIKNNAKILRCRAMRGAQCDTDHRLLRLTVKARPKRFYPPQKRTQAYDIGKLKNTETQNRFEEQIATNIQERNINSDDHSLEEIWVSFKDSYTKAASQVLGKRRSKQSDWFDECDKEIRSELDAKKKAHQKYLSTPTEQNKEAYKEHHRKCQRKVREIREEWWNNKMTELQEHMNTGDMYNLYRGITSVVGPIRKPLCILEDESGNSIKCKTRRLETWRSHFEKVYNQEATASLDHITIEPITTDLPDDGPPTVAEITKAICQLKNRKSPGSDAITSELIKGARATSTHLLHEMFKKVWEERQVPADW